MLDFLGALWNYAAEYFITLMGVAAFAGIIYYGGITARERSKFRREQKKLLDAWNLK